MNCCDWESLAFEAINYRLPARSSVSFSVISFVILKHEPRAFQGLHCKGALFFFPSRLSPPSSTTTVHRFAVPLQGAFTTLDLQSQSLSQATAPHSQSALCPPQPIIREPWQPRLSLLAKKLPSTGLDMSLSQGVFFIEEIPSGQTTRRSCKLVWSLCQPHVP